MRVRKKDKYEGVLCVEDGCELGAACKGRCHKHYQAYLLRLKRGFEPWGEEGKRPGSPDARDRVPPDEPREAPGGPHSVVADVRPIDDKRLALAMRIAGAALRQSQVRAALTAAVYAELEKESL